MIFVASNLPEAASSATGADAWVELPQPMFLAAVFCFLQSLALFWSGMNPEWHDPMQTLPEKPGNLCPNRSDQSVVVGPNLLRHQCAAIALPEKIRKRKRKASAQSSAKTNRLCLLPIGINDPASWPSVPFSHFLIPPQRFNRRNLNEVPLRAKRLPTTAKRALQPLWTDSVTVTATVTVDSFSAPPSASGTRLQN